LKSAKGLIQMVKETPNLQKEVATILGEEVKESY